MKKLLLLLSISLAFIGSANANSIEGAFGYKLGDVDKSIETKQWGLFNMSMLQAKRDFIPKNPVPFLEDYSVHATPISHKIFKVRASKRISYTDAYISYDICKFLKGYSFGDLLAMLKARYGDVFEITRNDSFEGTYEGKKVRNANLILIYSNNDRYIQLECNDNFHEPWTIYLLSIEYIDSDLEKLAYKERIELENKKILEESSDYDL